MKNPALETLNRTLAATAPVTAMLDRVRAIGATPLAIADFNRKVAAQTDKLTIKKDV